MLLPACRHPVNKPLNILRDIENSGLRLLKKSLNGRPIPDALKGSDRPMQQRLTVLLIAAGLVGLAAGGWLAASASNPAPGRISFQIATGSTAGTFFPVGEAIGGLISHPPGVDRCDAAPVCGPAGLVISVRTSQGAVDNVLEVDQGDTDSGFAQADVVAAALRGAAPFKIK